MDHGLTWLAFCKKKAAPQKRRAALEAFNSTLRSIMLPLSWGSSLIPVAEIF